VYQKTIAVLFVIFLLIIKSETYNVPQCYSFSIPFVVGKYKNNNTYYLQPAYSYQNTIERLLTCKLTTALKEKKSS
jgi:hypothetical protein